MKVNEILIEKIIHMADEVGQEILDGLDRNYYERDIVDRVKAREEISIAEAVEAITWLREEINRQEASTLGHFGPDISPRGYGSERS